MNNVLHGDTVNELIVRIGRLTSSNTALWGTMTPYRMVRHCILSEEMFLGARTYERLFAGRLFGRMLLRGILKNDEPLKRNQPTHPLLKITGSGDVEVGKASWIALLNRYPHLSNERFVHPFFGYMTTEQIGRYVYKHTDHHLRQFGL